MQLQPLLATCLSAALALAGCRQDSGQTPTAPDNLAATRSALTSALAQIGRVNEGVREHVRSRLSAMLMELEHKDGSQLALPRVIEAHIEQRYPFEDIFHFSVALVTDPTDPVIELGLVDRAGRLLGSVENPSVSAPVYWRSALISSRERPCDLEIMLVENTASVGGARKPLLRIQLAKLNGAHVAIRARSGATDEATLFVPRVKPLTELAQAVITRHIRNQPATGSSEVAAALQALTADALIQRAVTSAGLHRAAVADLMTAALARMSEPHFDQPRAPVAIWDVKNEHVDITLIWLESGFRATGIYVEMANGREVSFPDSLHWDPEWEVGALWEDLLRVQGVRLSSMSVTVPEEAGPFCERQPLVLEDTSSITVVGLVSDDGTKIQAELIRGPE